jgi:hypothetical protein
MGQNRCVRRDARPGGEAYSPSAHDRPARQETSNDWASLRDVLARDTDFFADLAAQYIGATLGVEVERWDTNGRQGAHDLRYEHDGRSVAVEVKRILDLDFRQMEGALDKTSYVRDERLQRSWDVLLRHGASISQARQEIPGLLVLLEQTGWLDVWEPWQLRLSHPWLAAWLERLGAQNLWSDHRQTFTRWAFG